MSRFNGNLTDALGVIASFSVEDIPTFTTLVNEFGLFQNWYCSVPSSTWPNRLYAHSATSSGEVETSDFLRMIIGYPQKTVYDLLDENGIDWNVFFAELPDPLLFQSFREIDSLAKLRPLFEFESMATAGTLPAFSWISPRFFEIPCIPANDQHPPHDFALGEDRIKTIYEALRNSPLWNKTALIITYDENGGFSDHVSPPHDVPSPDNIKAPNGFNFDRLGIRVPTIVVSPWVDAGTLINEPTPSQMPPGVTDSHFDHTSIIATVRKLFNISSSLTARDAWASSFDNLFHIRSTPRDDCPTTLPQPAIPPTYRATGGDVLSDLQWDVIRIAAGAAGITDIPSNLRTELDGAKFVVNAVFNSILKREVPASMAAALKLSPGYELGACDAVNRMVMEEVNRPTKPALETA